MRGIFRMSVAVVATMLISVAGFAQPASAVPDSDMLCTFTLDQQVHVVSGTCSGHTHLGAAGGSFDGDYRPNGTAKGSFKLKLGPATTLKGQFKGWSFNEPYAKGDFWVKLGSLRLSGTFTASLG